jgi:H+/Cl- antiporter ClcA
MRVLGILLLVVGLVGFAIIAFCIFHEVMGDYPSQNLHNIVGIAWPILLAMIVVGFVLIIASLVIAGWKKQAGSKIPGESCKLNDRPGDEL